MDAEKIIDTFIEEVRNHYIENSEDLFKNEIVKQMDSRELLTLLKKEKYIVDDFVNGVEIRRGSFSSSYGNIIRRNNKILVLE